VRRRLAVTAAAVTAMVVLAFCVPLALVVRVVAHDRAMHAAELESRSLAAVLAGTRDPAVLEPIVGQANAGSTRPASIFLPSGRVIGAPADEDEDVARARAGGAFVADVEGGRAVFVPVQNTDGVAVVRVLVPGHELNRGVAAGWLLLGVLAVGLVALAVVLADRLGRSFVRPMEHLADVANRLREGDLAARAGDTGPREVAAIATALNGLADRIDDLVAAGRESAADLSHRLRTPVTALRLDAERLEHAADRERLIAEIDALEHAIDEIIRVARSARTVTDGPVDLAAAVRTRLAFWSVLGRDQGRPITASITNEPCLVSVPRGQLDAAIDALVGNVFAHTPRGTAARVEVLPASNGHAPVLIVEDDGPGIDDPQVLTRGVSGAGSTGLGLDIARQAAEHAGGSLMIGRSQSGGARVALVFGPKSQNRRRGRAVRSGT